MKNQFKKITHSILYPLLFFLVKFSFSALLRVNKNKNKDFFPKIVLQSVDPFLIGVSISCAFVSSDSWPLT